MLLDESPGSHAKLSITVVTAQNIITTAGADGGPSVCHRCPTSKSVVPDKQEKPSHAQSQLHLQLQARTVAPLSLLFRTHLLYLTSRHA